jgi:hypothetical protein
MRRIARTGLIHQEMRRTPFRCLGRFVRLRRDGGLAIDLSLPRAKPPEVMQGEWDHYGQIGVIPAHCIDRPVNRMAATFGP